MPVLAVLVLLYAVTSHTGVLSFGNGLAIGIGVFNVANTRPRSTAIISATITRVAVVLISLNAGVATASMEKNPQKAQDALAMIRGAARTVLGEIADLLDVLRAGEDPVDGRTSPQPDLSQVDTLVAEFAKAEMRVTVRTEGDISRVSPAVGLVAYRVLQEALTNAHNHGTEGRAHVRLEVDGDVEELRLSVTNPVGHQSRPAGTGGASGVGNAAVTGGYGLVGIRERVATVGGSVGTEPVVGGFRLTATLPLTKEERT